MKKLVKAVNEKMLESEKINETREEVTQKIYKEYNSFVEKINSGINSGIKEIDTSHNTITYKPFNNEIHIALVYGNVRLCYSDGDKMTKPSVDSIKLFCENLPDALRHFAEEIDKNNAAKREKIDRLFLVLNKISLFLSEIK